MASEAAAVCSFNGALSALSDASNNLPCEVWRGGVLPFLSNADVLRLSSACSTLIPVAAAGMRRLQLSVPAGGTPEQLASLLQRAPNEVLEVSFALGQEAAADVFVVTIAEHCTALTSLNVSGCRNLTDAAIQAIAEHCPGLTSLSVSHSKNLTDAAIQAIKIQHASLIINGR